MKKSPLQIFLAFVCLLFSLKHAAYGMNDDKSEETTTGIKFSSLDTIHFSTHSSKTSGLQFSEVNAPERSDKLSWVIDPNEFAQLGSLYKSIYEDGISCWSSDKISSIRIDLHGKSIEEAKKSVIDLIYRCHASKEATSIHFICGHGKHKNSKGDRGTLFKNFPEWLKEEAIVHLIKSCHSTLGAYDVVLNSNGSSERSETAEKVLKVSFIELVAKHGDALGQYILGRMYLSGG